MAPAKTAKRAGSKRKNDGDNQFSSRKKAAFHDEELSGEDLSGEEEERVESGEDGSEDEFAGETADETRLRLAKQYLATVTNEVKKIEEDDDADTFNQDAIAHRLQQDIAEAKGKRYKQVADNLVGKEIHASQVFRGHKLSVTSIALSGDDKTLFSAGKEGMVYQWDMESGAKKRIFPDEKYGKIINGLAVSQDGQYVAIGGKDSLVHVYDVRQQKLASSFKGHRDAVTCLAFRKGTHQLFSGSLDRTIKIWNLDEMCYVETLFGHQCQINGIASLLRERCVSVGRDRTMRLWKVMEESQLIFRGHTHSIDTVAMSNEEFFCGGSQDGGVSLWSVMKKKPTVIRRLAHGADEFGNPNWISSVAALNYSDLIASGSCDGLVRLWKCADQNSSLEEIAQLPVKGFVNSLCFSSTGKFLVAGVGQEHRLGRWRRIGDAKNSIVVLPLSDEDLV
eukprot:761550-Hanusia_phi.AAC.11